MKTSLLLLSGLLAAAAAFPNGSPQKCTPGEVRQVDCNTCTCTSAGVLACTRMACLPETLQCRYGQTYVDQCTNICNCDDNGYSCTRKACLSGQGATVPLSCNGTDNLPKLANKRVSCHEGIVKVQSLDEKCLPGAVFMDAEDCNSCSCGENGQEGCTREFCLKDVAPKECTPGEVRQVDCNTCTCTPAGVLACTRMACLPETLQCRYGQTYVDQCTNICNCGDNGYSCTRKACLSGQGATVPLSCNGTDNLPKLANKRVSCHEGIVKVQSLDEKCLPGAVFLDAEDCNSCFCGENGQEGCTLKLCLKAEGPTV